MNLDLQSLSAEPLIYMLMHSGVFVTVLGATFFIIGLLFGYATWGRYKSLSRELKSEVLAMKEEIANLKRRVGDSAIKAISGVAMITETIQMPRDEPKGKSDSSPDVKRTLDWKPAEDRRIEQVATGGDTASLEGSFHTIKAKNLAKKGDPYESTGGILDGLGKKPASTSIEIVPSGDLSAPAKHGSPLASIIATVPGHRKEEEVSVMAEDILTLPELPAASETVDGEFHMDSKLGLIYTERPLECDDLTALKGIASVLEKRLHDLGIFTWKQIADWNENHIKEFSSRLAFKDRIDREQWVAQAKRLVASKSVKMTE